MHRTHRTAAFVGTATLLAAVLTGCSATDDDTAAAPSTPSATAAAPAPTDGATAQLTPAPAPPAVDGKIQGVSADLFTPAWDLFANARVEPDGLAVVGAVATAQTQFKAAGQQAFALFALSSGNYRVGVLYLADDAGKKAFYDTADIDVNGHPTKDAALAELQPLIDANPDAPVLDFTS